MRRSFTFKMGLSTDDRFITKRSEISNMNPNLSLTKLSKMSKNIGKNVHFLMFFTFSCFSFAKTCPFRFGEERLPLTKWLLSRQTAITIISHILSNAYSLNPTTDARTNPSLEYFCIQTEQSRDCVWRMNFSILSWRCEIKRTMWLRPVFGHSWRCSGGCSSPDAENLTLNPFSWNTH